MAANAEAKKEGIIVPMTLEDYCLKPKRNDDANDPSMDPSFYDDFDLETEDDLPTDDDDDEYNE